MHPVETRFEKALLKRLAEERQAKLEQIGVGVEIDTYKFWTGYVRCLKDVEGIIAEVRKKLDE